MSITVNRAARHEYFVLETYECGIELFGTEIKSIRNGSVNLKESWADIQNGEVFVYGMHISPYEKGNIFNRDPFRVRKLLLHKKEINKLLGKIKQDGYVAISLSPRVFQIAVPVYKNHEVYAAVAAYLPEFLLSEQEKQTMIQKLCEVAHEIEERI